MHLASSVIDLELNECSPTLMLCGFAHIALSSNTTNGNTCPRHATVLCRA
jgi:hypothetical protein